MLRRRVSCFISTHELNSAVKFKMNELEMHALEICIICLFMICFMRKIIFETKQVLSKQKVYFTQLHGMAAHMKMQYFYLLTNSIIIIIIIG